MDVHTRVVVDVGNGEHIPDFIGSDHESRLLLYLPHHSLLGILVVVHEAARQVERSLGGFLTPAGHQQFSFPIEDEGSRRGAGVLVVRKPTVSTMPAQGVMDLKVTTAALRTVPEYL